jgi:pimeloyl-ACP methyl ester carboxylesterase
MIGMPRSGSVRCLSTSGFHTMRYLEWGAADNPQVLVCVHGLTRVGRDFERLASALAERYRVVCPDVAGRGRSDWLADPRLYAVPQYAFDMTTLIARLGVETVHWLGTSMGGLIGLSLAGQPNSPIARLVLNDVGPRLELAALTRIADYVGQAKHFETLQQATDYVRSVSASFGLQTDDDWRELARSVVRHDAAGWSLHYDPAIANAFKNLSEEAAAVAEAGLWKLYDAVHCPTLLVRGAQSDLLSEATAQEMARRGPHAQLVQVEGVGHAPMFFDEAQIAVVRRFLLAA